MTSQLCPECMLYPFTNPIHYWWFWLIIVIIFIINAFFMLYWMWKYEK